MILIRRGVIYRCNSECCFFFSLFFLDDIMILIGTEIAKMHLANIIHGDLTTSNMMVQRNPEGSPSPSRVVSINVFLLLPL
jgi:hypothetical protein